ncbi:MAG: multidrug ABC transporter ATP-binding protein [Micavibrio aeruginosavorus]|uniref:Multidrug ABC transporter ATP-binding protein n=1 Tax=Micavibrio aeruginosavorus TaxID=349221 RepID=A0A2W5PUL0_9BACT|nr:MAG: multidrug ABC transporter ATP-binding protein [Micavibrio aeruginosavorus]
MLRVMKNAYIIDQLPENNLIELPTKVGAFLWFFMRQIKGRLLALSLLGVAGGALGSLSAYFFGQIVEVFVSTTDKSQLWDHLVTPFAFYTVLILIASPALYNTQGWLSSHTLPYYASMVRRQLALYLHQHSYRYFQDDFAGRLAGKVLEMPYAMRQIVNDITGPFIYAGTTFVVTLAVFSWIGLYFAAFTALYIFCYTLNLRYFIPRIRGLAEIASRRRSVMRGRYVDIITNIFLVKIFARRAHEDAYFRESLHETSGAVTKQELTITAMFRVQHVMNSTFMFTLVLAAVHAWNQDSLTTAQISMVLPMALNMISATFWLTEIYTGFFERLGEVQEGMEAVVQTHDVLDKPDAGHLVVKTPSLAFENVAFSYPSRPMFSDFTLKIEPRQRIGLVGPSGAGKSTMMQLILRLHDVQGGKITIDGQNIADMTQESVRSSIAVIPQSADMLHRTVRENIAYGKPGATEDEIINAAKRAQAHDFIKDLRDAKGNQGYDAAVGERGVKLSGGQRQRIAIARAILKDAPILILDEATASLDSESEKLIQAALEDVMKDRTVIVIAHRLSTIAHLDRLIVLEGGKIVEDGTHKELLERNGLYARLWGLQSGGFLADAHKHIED